MNRHNAGDWFAWELVAVTSVVTAGFPRRRSEYAMLELILVLYSPAVAARCNLGTTESAASYVAVVAVAVVAAVELSISQKSFPSFLATVQDWEPLSTRLLVHHGWSWVPAAEQNRHGCDSCPKR